MSDNSTANQIPKDDLEWVTEFQRLKDELLADDLSELERRQRLPLVENIRWRQSPEGKAWENKNIDRLKRLAVAVEQLILCAEDLRIAHPGLRTLLAAFDRSHGYGITVPSLLREGNPSRDVNDIARKAHRRAGDDTSRNRPIWKWLLWPFGEVPRKGRELVAISFWLLVALGACWLLNRYLHWGIDLSRFEFWRTKSSLRY